MSLAQPWNLGCYSWWLAAGGILKPSSFILKQDKFLGVIYIPELSMGQAKAQMYLISPSS